MESFTIAPNDPSAKCLLTIPVTLGSGIEVLVPKERMFPLEVNHRFP